jgi:hypothetical protein
MRLHETVTGCALSINNNVAGDINMRNQFKSLLAVFVMLLASGMAAHAGCTNEQFAGTWDVVFSDGNSCRLVLTAEGEVLANPDRSLSTCFDPFRGETAPDSGSFDVASECLVTFALEVEGNEIQMVGRIAKTRDIGAGGYVVLLDEFPYAQKGSFNMIKI